MTLLTIVSGAARRLRFAAIPTSVVANPDPDVQQLYGFAQDTGNELVERWDWANLKQEASVTGDGVTTLFSLPGDWQRLCPSDKSPYGAMVSLSRPYIPLIGPVNDEWLTLAKAAPTYPVYPAWRRIGSSLEFWPALADGEQVSFWYFSNFYAQDANGNRKTFSADDDVSLVGEDTIMKGVIWRWLQSKGLDYAEQFRQYELSIDRNAGQENTERTIRTATRAIYDADTFWPGTINYPP